MLRVPFDKITGEIHKKTYTSPQPPKYQDVFGHTLVELAKQNEKIIGVTPAMPSGSSMNIMMKEMPERAIDVGIAEQHAVTFSAGLATQGLIPFCNIYSTFMQRAYDQVIHDVCIQNLPVNFCLDRAGFAGADGPTHHGAYDIAYFRCLPNMIVSAPMNESELRNLMYTAQLQGTRERFPFVIHADKVLCRTGGHPWKKSRSAQVERSEKVRTLLSLLSVTLETTQLKFVNVYPSKTLKLATTTCDL
jgi:1-deoxy-D-xylulose-5-phosphate synthase